MDAGAVDEYATCRPWYGRVQRYNRVKIIMFIVCILIGRVLVYGGSDGGTNGDPFLDSVEMLSPDGLEWQTLSTPMFKADVYFSSVALPDEVRTTTMTSTRT